MTVYVLLRGGVDPQTYQGVYGTLAAAEEAAANLRLYLRELNFKVIKVEVEL